MRRALCIALLLTSCGTVRQSDLDAWTGRPVSDLDKHPVFLTMPVVRTVASDGTEIRNHVNARNIGACARGGAVFSGPIERAAFDRFTACTRSVAACNNVFYINNGIVTRYTPVGTGGARCETDTRTHPDFSGPTNVR
jgi:hypothetical protein